MVKDRRWVERSGKEEKKKRGERKRGGTRRREEMMWEEEWIREGERERKDVGRGEEERG